MTKKKKLTKKQFEQLKAMTEVHWKADILGASLVEILRQNPVNMEDCAVCRFFNDSCKSCFLCQRGHCLYVVCNAAESLSGLTGTCSIQEISKAYRICRIAYKAILKRFEKYEKEHFSRK